MAAALCLVALGLGAALGGQAFSIRDLLPPQPFRDRLQAQSRSLQLGVYDDAALAASWHQELGAAGPSHGFNHTRVLTASHVDFIRSKLHTEDRTSDLRVLDLGIGGGYVALGLASRPGWDILGVDRAPATVAATAAYVKRASLDRSKVTVQVGDHTRLPAASGSIDAVLTLNVLEQIGDLETAIQEIHRVLKPGGALVFGTTNRTWWSWLTEVLLGERLFRAIHPGTQDWRLFLTPAELKLHLEASGFWLTHEDLTGLCERPSFAPAAGRFPPVARTLHYERCVSLAGHYMGWATKPQLPLDVEAEDVFENADAESDVFEDAAEL